MTTIVWVAAELIQVLQVYKQKQDIIRLLLVTGEKLTLRVRGLGESILHAEILDENFQPEEYRHIPVSLIQDIRMRFVDNCDRKALDSLLKKTADEAQLRGDVSPRNME
jgi:glucose-6-phosphate isomerase